MNAYEILLLYDVDEQRPTGLFKSIRQWLEIDQLQRLIIKRIISKIDKFLHVRAKECWLHTLMSLNCWFTDQETEVI